MAGWRILLLALAMSLGAAPVYRELRSAELKAAAALA